MTMPLPNVFAIAHSGLDRALIGFGPEGLAGQAAWALGDGCRWGRRNRVSHSFHAQSFVPQATSSHFPPLVEGRLHLVTKL